MILHPGFKDPNLRLTRLLFSQMRMMMIKDINSQMIMNANVYMIMNNHLRKITNNSPQMVLNNNPYLSGEANNQDNLQMICTRVNRLRRGEM